jgi:hypothetical protein
MADERRKLGMVVSAFGISLMVAFGITFFKAVYLADFTDFMLN